MKYFTTQIKAICPIHKELFTWVGPHVPGIDIKSAQKYCDENGLGYCTVIGELVAEIPCKKGTNKPDFNKTIDYGKINLN